MKEWVTRDLRSFVISHDSRKTWTVWGRGQIIYWMGRTGRSLCEQNGKKVNFILLLSYKNKPNQQNLKCSTENWETGKIINWTQRGKEVKHKTSFANICDLSSRFIKTFPNLHEWWVTMPIRIWDLLLQGEDVEVHVAGDDAAVLRHVLADKVLVLPRVLGGLADLGGGNCWESIRLFWRTINDLY